MRRWWHDNLFYILTLAIWGGFFVYCMQRSAEDTISADRIADHIRHADTFYWFSLAGGDSPEALRRAVEQFDLAQRKLTASQLSSAEKKEVQTRLDGIYQDIRYQQLLNTETFRGVFPWSEFMVKPTLFLDDRATGTFELIDEPQVIACQNAILNLRSHVLGSQTVVAQYDVVFVTDPADFSSDLPENTAMELSKTLENEALYFFSLDPRFFVHNMLEVATALDPAEQEKLKALEPTESILKNLRVKWNNRDILIVRLKKLDEVNEHHFWLAQGRLFKDVDRATGPIAKESADAAVPADVVYNNYGYCRDRRYMLGAVLFFNALMALTAIVLFRYLSGLSSHNTLPAPWRAAIGLGTIGFLWGRVSVWGIVEIIERFIPADETLAVVSFWWPAIAGFVILFTPAFVARFTEKRFLHGWISKMFGTYNRRGPLFAVISLGSVTYLGQVSLWVRAWEGWSVLPPLVVGSIFAAWIIGRALDDTDAIKRSWAMPMIVMGLFIGLAFSHADSISHHLVGLWLTAISICLIGITALIRTGRLVRFLSHQPVETKSEAPVESVSNLIRHIQDPPYRKTKTFKQVSNILREGRAGHHGPTAVWVDKSTVRIQLIGPAGIGKTALLQAIRSSEVKRDDTIVMMGDCAEPTAGSIAESYRPFVDAIADHFAINLLLPPQKQMLGIDKAINGIFDQVVPFSDLLFPPSHHDGASGSKSELFNSIVILIRHLAEKRRVILMIDDAQWIDAASRELLEYLIAEFPAGDNSGVALIVSSRTPTAGFSASETIMVEKLTEAEITSLLVEGLRFTPAAGQHLAAAVSEEKGNMHWLFQMVNHLADKHVLTWQQSGFGWDVNTKLSDHVPPDLLRSVELMLENHPKFRRVLECAACIGPTFSVEVLSQALEESRLETIQQLDQIEQQTGIVRDLQHQDDSFEFRSSFILEVLRQMFGVNAHGPNLPSPQRIREYHARLAGAWAGTLQQSPSALFRLANHRYAAGLRHAHLALQETVSAARASSAQYQHELARQYISMARECVDAAGLDQQSLERELLLIECHEAHVEGRHRQQVADAALKMLADHPDSDFEIYAAAALACYDAGSDMRDQQYFANSVAIGRNIVERFPTPVEQAAGHHFIGIGLPLSAGEQRRKHLEKALQLAEQAGDGIEALKLKGRIANSLAELLSNSDSADQVTARELFMQSIELKSQPRIRDVAGLAFAHGGLGRLAFFAEQVDCATARKHFLEDLRYSELIGSLTGQTKMHSMLAACDLYEARLEQDMPGYEKALESYEKAYRLLEAQFDMFFALAGLVECHEVLGDQVKADEYGQALVELVQDRLKTLSDQERRENPVAAIPVQCLENIRQALRQCRETPARAWHHFLSELLVHNRLNVRE
jgi:hypothetical protein